MPFTPTGATEKLSVICHRFAVTVSNLFRIGHWPGNASNYNMSGGTLDLTGTPTGTVNGVNNNLTPEQAGIIYLGIDGTGNFTQTVSLSWSRYSTSASASTVLSTTDHITGIEPRTSVPFIANFISSSAIAASAGKCMGS